MPKNLTDDFIYGFIAALIIGFIIKQIRDSKNKFVKRYSPLDTFPDAVQPKLTPAKIVWDSTKALFTCLIWLIVLLVFVYYLYVFLYQW